MARGEPKNPQRVKLQQPKGPIKRTGVAHPAKETEGLRPQEKVADHKGFHTTVGKETSQSEGPTTSTDPKLEQEYYSLNWTD